ncbi:hypothetical protein VTJ04DRAFT_7180 [Mycothermus thermophilus]|uniref:uncharacterized protein n=1 Tax=Humicola insolens TaxID=85995 RepID=UPI003742B412
MSTRNPEPRLTSGYLPPPAANRIPHSRTRRTFCPGPRGCEESRQRDGDLHVSPRASVSELQVQPKKASGYAGHFGHLTGSSDARLRYAASVDGRPQAEGRAGERRSRQPGGTAYTACDTA